MRMVPVERLDIDVEVRHDGRWHAGVLEHWRRDGDRWRGFVRYSVGVGMTHIAWVDQGGIRQV